MPYSTLAMHRLAMMANQEAHGSEHPRIRPLITPQGSLRVHIEAGVLRLDYQASAEQAHDVAQQLTQSFLHLVVSVDHEIRPDLPPLPCAELWN